MIRFTEKLNKVVVVLLLFLIQCYFASCDFGRNTVTKVALNHKENAKKI